MPNRSGPRRSGRTSKSTATSPDRPYTMGSSTPMFDKFREECGVFGIFGHPEASKLSYLGLYALQHRGQESAGIAAWDGGQIRVSKAMGHVNDAVNDDVLAKLPGEIAVGHVRYSTAGESRLANAQPLVVDSMHGPLAVCHN